VRRRLEPNAPLRRDVDAVQREHGGAESLSHRRC
jgi:hypothetical protein